MTQQILKCLMKKCVTFLVLLSTLSIQFSPASACAGLWVLPELRGKQAACYLADPNGRMLVAENIDEALIPASILKILTALAAYHYLGPDYRFHTDLHIDSSDNLIIKGFGDPLLTSEVLTDITGQIASYFSRNQKRIKRLIVDSSYFIEPLFIPGVSDSFEPYDAPNGALCANFNTVSFKRLKNGEFISGEPQTPLLPFIMGRIRSSGLPEGRIPLSDNNHETALYVGELAAYFLAQKGISTDKSVGLGKVDPNDHRLILSFISPHSMDDTVSKLLAHSSNFIANQLVLAIGAKAFAPPASLDKSVRAVTDYAVKSLGIQDLTIVEGSGISRENRISARSMAKLLNAFFPHRDLLRQTEREYFKTGTLSGISTRAGYLKGVDGKLYPFVVMLNCQGLSTEWVIDKLQQMIRP